MQRQPIATSHFTAIVDFKTPAIFADQVLAETKMTIEY
jgi:hypothetical protein